VVQIGSGQSLAQGGPECPVNYTHPYHDVPTALMSVFGMCVALFYRLRTGEGQRVTTSLAATSLMVQSDELIEYGGRPPAAMGGCDYQGPAPLDRIYATSDGWLRLQALTPEDVARFWKTGLVAETARALSGDALSDELQRVFGQRTTGEAVDILLRARVPVVPVTRAFKDIMAISPVGTEKLLMDGVLANGRVVRTPGRYGRFSRTEFQGTARPPGLGEHTREVLSSLGYTDAEIEALAASGAVAFGTPFTL
jgi:crotonobetainyl-CoA:carnitine CoA-transferase CaiB-like acyl-CoA transferase